MWNPFLCFHGWCGIFIGKNLLKSKLGKVIGSWNDTYIWSDPWLSLLEPQCPMGPVIEKTKSWKYLTWEKKVHFSGTERLSRNFFQKWKKQSSKSNQALEELQMNGFGLHQIQVPTLQRLDIMRLSRRILKYRATISSLITQTESLIGVKISGT